MQDESVQSNFRFSIWDLVALTTYVAILFALPANILSFSLAISLTVFVLLFFLVIPVVFPARDNVKGGPVNRFLHRVIYRAFVFAVVTLVVGGLAFFLKNVS